MISKSERSYIHTSLLSDPPTRADGRSLLDFRSVALELGVTAPANGSARVRIGGDAGFESGGGGVCGTEVTVAVKLEVEDVSGEGSDRGRLSCNVSCSPAAFPSLTMLQLDDLQADLTSIFETTLSSPSLCPTNLSILPGKKAWLVHLDALILADDGNVYDALFIAAAAALRDTRVPRTRAVEYRANTSRNPPLPGQEQGSDDPMVGTSSLDTRALPKATDFELMDYWDEGEPLVCLGGASWPVCITLNMVPPIYYLDANSMEEEATMNRILLFFSFTSSEVGVQIEKEARLQGMRLLGHGEVDSTLLKPMLREGEKHAAKLFAALNLKVKSELARRNPQIPKTTKRNK